MAKGSQILGHTLSKDEIVVDTAKTGTVLDWNRPTTATEVRSFLRLADQYRRFVEGFSMIASPLTSLTRKDSKFEWGDKHEHAFQELKERLTSVPVLAIPKSDENFTIYADATH